MVQSPNHTVIELVEALFGSSVEQAHDGDWGYYGSQFLEEVETLVGFLGQCCSIVGPREILGNMDSQNLVLLTLSIEAPLMLILSEAD